MPAQAASATAATAAYHAYHSPELSFSRSLHSRANSATPNPNPGPVRSSSRRPLAFARDSTQSNSNSNSNSTSRTGSSRNSAWSTSATSSIDFSAYSRTSSNYFYDDSSSRSSAAPVLESPISPNYRDSFISILDDPFFQRLDDTAAAQATNTEAEFETLGQISFSSAEGRYDSNDHKNPQRWSLPRRESLTIGSLELLSQSHSNSTMESFNIAIIGAEGAGKSTFVQRILGIARPPQYNASNVRFVVDSSTHMITLLELDIESFDLNTVQPIQWPKQINGHIVPRVDAALIFFDVTNLETLRLIPRLLAALTDSGLPAIMVACKCDQPEDDWEIDADALANQKPFNQCQFHYKISMDSPELARACLQVAIRAAVAHRREEHGETVSRRRAQSAANLEAPDPAGRPMSEGRHSRASSDYSLLRGFTNSSAADNRIPGSRGGRPGLRVDKHGSESFLDVDESDAESYRYSDDIPILQRNDDVIIEKQPKMTGVMFDDLVDRLLSTRLTKADHSFSDVFLCLYRKFAAPGELLSAILTRLDRVRDDKTMHHLMKTMTQLRFIETVAKWVSLYPGDFARTATRRNLDELIKHLSPDPAFSTAARQMRRNLTYNVYEDDDTGWAHADDADDQLASKILSKELGDLPGAIGSLQFDDDTLYERPSGSSENLNRGSSTGSQVHHLSFDEYDREAATLEPTDHLPMNKNRYRIFMDIPDDDVADELTRIDWIMFSSIRVRDFVRHVSLPPSEKDSCKSLKNVNRMISHFNHIAQWVANMILLRDKAKHRAQILEKFMNIAIKLRQLNNYNGLAAVLAGINGTAIHRLSQTRSLVAPELQKKFARLGILMGTQKSHFAYRLAWENSPLPRIPFIPLHRRDLVSAEEGSKTFIGPAGDRINWKKFEVLGEVLLPLMKSQGTPYPNLATNENVRELILGCRMPTDEEEIYQRSLEVESSSSGGPEPAKKFPFPWFQNK
ncbi:Ras guanine nucleotide exchange factor A-like protein [Cladobotryum mycophilum]|uniref:Ras guanine nucleotide exchange factor A-like protein n=1 Tax=Cladobotryum mycophilum TaxID=491253 RepID=A0ABR0T1X3_9HYPO